MATLKDKLRWNIYKKKKIYYGIYNGLILSYEEELLIIIKYIGKIRIKYYKNHHIIYRNNYQNTTGNLFQIYS